MDAGRDGGAPLLAAAVPLLLAATAGWVALAAQRAGGDPWPVVTLLAGVAVAISGARLVARRWPAAVPVAVALAAAWLALARREVLLDGPLMSPLGYANATASFFVVAAAAALTVAARPLPGVLRVLALVVALGFAAVPWGNGSAAAAALTLLLPAALLCGVRSTAARPFTAAMAALGLAAFAVTVVVGLLTALDSLPAGVERLVDGTLTQRRRVLWADALELVAAQPLTGVGPGRFAVTSPTATADADAAWAHHALLQLGAEAGIPALLGALLLLGCLFAWLWRSRPDIQTALAAAAVAAVVVHACVDYVLHTPPVPLAAAALLGSAVARRSAPIVC